MLKNFDFNIAKYKVELLFDYFFNKTVLSLVILAVCIMYIYYTEKNKKIRDFFVIYTLIILFIICNPLFIHIIESFINFGSLYRLYYMIPMYIIIAYVFTKIIRKKSHKLIYILLLPLILGLFGKSVYNEIGLMKYNNFYKLPDETVFVAETIYNDELYAEYKKAIVPYGMSSQIQQIYPNIKLAYTRFVSNVESNGLPSPSDTDDPSGYEIIQKMNEGDTRYICEYCENELINYIAIYDNINIKQPFENFGFEKIDSNYGVSVYRKTNF